MESYGESYISPIHKRNDYIRLNLERDSSETSWKKALEIFSARMQGRYFDVKDSLHNDVNKNGFAIMALECLLIETLYQFRKGIPTAQLGRNKECYSNFLQQHFSRTFDSRRKAECFYTDIRCGILHSAQTKNGSQLTYRKSYVVEMFEEEQKISVDVEMFSKIVKDYHQNYIYKLTQSREKCLRENFIKKMKSICRNEN